MREKELVYNASFEFRRQIFFIFLFFGLAKISEKFDKEIYHLIRNTISGHSFKHLLMVAAGYKIIAIVRNYKN